MKNERWLPIPKFQGYEVSDMGRVRSWWVPGHHQLSKTPYLLKFSITTTGYVRIRLCRDRHGHHRFVHKLVLETFRGPYPPGYETIHINENPGDNQLINLYWGTHKTNLLGMKFRTRTSKAQRKLWLCPEYRKRQSEARRGHRVTAETRRKISKGRAIGVSGYRGVWSYGKRWRVYIGCNSKMMYIGMFDSARKAALAYDKKELKLYGIDAITNKSLNLL